MAEPHEWTGLVLPSCSFNWPSDGIQWYTHAHTHQHGSLTGRDGYDEGFGPPLQFSSNMKIPKDRAFRSMASNVSWSMRVARGRRQWKCRTQQRRTKEVEGQNGILDEGRQAMKSENEENGRSLTGPKGRSQKGMLCVTKGEEWKQRVSGPNFCLTYSL